jgi:branched-chain amino acid transport system permease protein
VPSRGGSATLAAAAVAALAAALAACNFSVDAEQARICRIALPALNAPGSRVVVERVQPGPGERSVRLEYRVEGLVGPPLRHWALCRFAAAGLSPNKAELVGVETDRGPLSGSSVYLLGRFYVDSVEGLMGDPGQGDRAAGVREAPEPVAYLVQQVLVGLPRTGIYGLLAAAYALVFGLVGRINLAFGELAAIGAAAAVSGVALASSLGCSAPFAGLGLGLLCAVFAGALYSVVGGHFTVARITSRSPQPSLIATVGLSLFLMEYLRLAQSPVTVWVPPIWSDSMPLLRAGSFVVGVTPVSLVTGGVAVGAAAGLLMLMRRSGFGRAWRAYADDRKAAALSGVDGRGLLIRTLALAGGMAGLAGTLVVVQYGGLGFAGGFQLGLKALIAAVLGGIGSVAGALLGGIAIGAFETLWSAYFPIEMRDVALYASLVAVLVFRPGGLLGSRDPGPRDV